MVWSRVPLRHCLQAIDLVPSQGSLGSNDGTGVVMPWPAFVLMIIQKVWLMYGPTLHVCTFPWKPIVWNSKLLKPHFHRNTLLHQSFWACSVLSLCPEAPYPVPPPNMYSHFFLGRWPSFYIDPIHALWPISGPSTPTKSSLFTPALWHFHCFSSSLVLIACLFGTCPHLPSIQWCAGKCLKTSSLREGENADL